MIEGNSIFEHLDGVCACELLPDALRAIDGELDKSSFDPDGLLTLIGYTIDNTTNRRGRYSRSIMESTNSTM